MWRLHGSWPPAASRSARNHSGSPSFSLSHPRAWPQGSAPGPPPADRPRVRVFSHPGKGKSGPWAPCPSLPAWKVQPQLRAKTPCGGMTSSLTGLSLTPHPHIALGCCRRLGPQPPPPGPPTSPSSPGKWERAELDVCSGCGLAASVPGRESRGQKGTPVSNLRGPPRHLPKATQGAEARAAAGSRPPSRQWGR